MAHTFEINKEALRRQFSVYVVVASSAHSVQLYVGKTGDNREGCNPVISRCGNHFSYNRIHSQIRNKVSDHERQSYTYVFDHFGAYPDDELIRRRLIDQINEMERYLNCEIGALCDRRENCVLINKYHGAAKHSRAEVARRMAHRTPENVEKIASIVRSTEDVVDKVLGNSCAPIELPA